LLGLFLPDLFLAVAMSRRRSFNRRLRYEPLEDRRLLATITVNTTIDEADGSLADGDISLRDAINLSAANDTINFSVTGAINLAIGATVLDKQLTINKNLTINGPGSSLLTINAYDPTPTLNNGDGSRVFRIDDGNSSTFLSVSISGLTVSGGDRTVGNPSEGFGGGVFSSENLTLTGMTISDNAATNAGGIYGGLGSLTVINCTITDNVASSSVASQGGGISVQLGVVTVTGSTISNNTATGSGGGLSIFRANSTITSSTINDNSAGRGGGIEMAESNLTVLSSTISGNSATSTSAQAGGGGIFHDLFAPMPGNGVLQLIHTTVTANRSAASSSGGGVKSLRFAATSLDHAIVAGNRSGPGAGAPDDIANPGTLFTPVATRFSLIGVDTGARLTDNGGNLIGTAASPIDPMLGPLANNGGQTLTHMLLPCSPAIDAGNGAIVGAPAYDQRGAPYTRILDGYLSLGTRIDIGAIEFNPVPPALPGDYNRDCVVDAADYIVWRKALGATGLPVYFGADGSGNGSIGQEDLAVWRANFGKSLPAATLTGDYNFSGVVDAADYIVWRQTLGTNGVPAYSGADGDGDGTIDPGDLAVWRAHFGQTAQAVGSGSEAAVLASREGSISATAVMDFVHNRVEPAAQDPGLVTAYQRVPYSNQPEVKAGAVGRFGAAAKLLVPPAYLRDAGLVAWLTSRDDGREMDADDSGGTEDGHDCPSYFRAVDTAFDEKVGALRWDVTTMELSRRG
jgi:hypothetical protein